MVQGVARPELRSAAMAITGFLRGAAASIIIMRFGRFADRYDLTQTLPVLACGFWGVALLATTAYYAVYPADAQRLRERMQERRTLIVGEQEGSPRAAG